MKTLACAIISRSSAPHNSSIAAPLSDRSPREPAPFLCRHTTRTTARHPLAQQTLAASPYTSLNLGRCHLLISSVQRAAARNPIPRHPAIPCALLHLLASSCRCFVSATALQARPLRHPRAPQSTNTGRASACPLALPQSPLPFTAPQANPSSDRSLLSQGHLPPTLGPVPAQALPQRPQCPASLACAASTRKAASPSSLLPYSTPAPPLFDSRTHLLLSSSCDTICQIAKPFNPLRTLSKCRQSCTKHLPHIPWLPSKAAILQAFLATSLLRAINQTRHLQNLVPRSFG